MITITAKLPTFILFYFLLGEDGRMRVNKLVNRQTRLRKITEKDGFPIPIFMSTSFTGMTERRTGMTLIKQGFTGQA
jgi:hypothetical protein